MGTEFLLPIKSCTREPHSVVKYSRRLAVVINSATTVINTVILVKITDMAVPPPRPPPGTQSGDTKVIGKPSDLKNGTSWNPTGVLMFQYGGILAESLCWLAFQDPGMISVPLISEANLLIKSSITQGHKWKALIPSKGYTTFLCSYFSFNPSISWLRR